MNTNAIGSYWEHFDHDADIGIRGVAASLEQAFAQAALALTAVITDPSLVKEASAIKISCEAPSHELLFFEWINVLVYMMATNYFLYRRFEVHLDNSLLTATAWGEPLDISKHQPAIEIKGATFTELRVYQNSDGMWVAQCVVDV